MSKKKPKNKHRNASSAAAAPRRPRARQAPTDELDVWTILAAVGGGIGGAAAGGYLAEKLDWSPEAVSAVMVFGGGVAAVATDGPARVASMGLAAAGAGQLAKTILGDGERAQIHKAAEKLSADRIAAVEKGAAEKIAAAEKAAAKAIAAQLAEKAAAKPANDAAPYDTEEAFLRARERLADLRDVDRADRYAAA